NKKEYDRLSDHIGLLPLVMISPEDSSLITEGSEYRRKFIDIIVSQLDKTYLNNLMNYNKIVLQRNSLLRRFAESGTFYKELLEAMDVQMIGLGVYIHEKRLNFIEAFLPIFEKHYEFITNGKEKVSIEYQSQLNDMDFKKILNDAIDKDKRFQYSTVGVHKDDLVFKIEDYQIKKFGSQGQQKSFLIALKLAQFDFIKSIKKFKPILLLDDIFDKLDALRVQKLMELVSDNNFGQIFITHTHPQRLSKILSDINAEYKVYEIEQGVVGDG
ncbi:DNA replication and repair protein RecF, partial [bacterium AH-315-M05]|nr:DNA replication and repair protein RecF [bacterium AH-315-M05]